MTTHAVIFDFDDLMVHSAPLHFEATRRVFAEHDITYTLDREVTRSLYGRRIPDVVDILFNHLGVTLEKAHFLARRNRYFIELFESQLTAMPGLADIISLVDGLGLQRALASSGERSYLNAALPHLDLVDFFHTIVSGDDVTRGKPDPEIFLLAARHLKVDPQACVVLEDSTAGIEAAKRAGMTAIGVENPHAPVRQDLSKADDVVQHLGAITADHFQDL
jgi:HAD superfamily hydrolase (TIGR01509 family)